MTDIERTTDFLSSAFLAIVAGALVMPSGSLLSTSARRRSGTDALTCQHYHDKIGGGVTYIGTVIDTGPFIGPGRTPTMPTPAPPPAPVPGAGIGAAPLFGPGAGLDRVLLTPTPIPRGATSRARTGVGGAGPGDPAAEAGVEVLAGTDG